MYAKVDNGIVVGTMYLVPDVYQNISGFSSLSDEELSKYGFHPLVEVKPPINSNAVDLGEVDDEGNSVYLMVDTQFYGPSVDELVDGKVVRTYPIITRPEKDIKDETNRPVLKKIASIEQTQARAVREAILGDTTFLVKINDQVTALRSKLI